MIEGEDIVIGSKYVAGAKMKRRPFRLFTSYVYNVCAGFLFKTHIRDHLCGFKAFKRDVILKLVDEMGYDKSLRRGIFWDTELLIRAHRHGYSIKEVPIKWTEGVKSNLYFKREIKLLIYIFGFIKRIRDEKR